MGWPWLELVCGKVFQLCLRFWQPYSHLVLLCPVFIQRSVLLPSEVRCLPRWGWVPPPGQNRPLPGHCGDRPGPLTATMGGCPVQCSRHERQRRLLGSKIRSSLYTYVLYTITSVFIFKKFVGFHVQKVAYEGISLQLHYWTFKFPNGKQAAWIVNKQQRSFGLDSGGHLPAYLWLCEKHQKFPHNQRTPSPASFLCKLFFHLSTFQRFCLWGACGITKKEESLIYSLHVCFLSTYLSRGWKATLIPRNSAECWTEIIIISLKTSVAPSSFWLCMKLGSVKIFKSLLLGHILHHASLKPPFHFFNQLITVISNGESRSQWWLMATNPLQAEK